MAAQDVLRDIGLSLDPASYNRPYAPGPAVAIGTALNTFGNISALEKQRGEEAKKKADRAAMEQRLGVPIDFFLSLPAANQSEILSKIGLGPEDLRSRKLPEFGGRTIKDIMAEGAPSPEAEAQGTGAFSGITGQVQTGPGIPAGLTPGTKEWADAMNRSLGITDLPPEPTALQAAQTREAQARAKNLESGKTAQGNARVKDLTPLQKRQVSAWLKANPYQEDGTPNGEDEAILALFPGGRGVGGLQQTRAWLNPDGQIVSDLDAQPGATPLVFDKTTGTYRKAGLGTPVTPGSTKPGVSPGITVTTPDGTKVSFPDQASANAFKAAHGIP